MCLQLPVQLCNQNVENEILRLIVIDCMSFYVQKCMSTLNINVAQKKVNDTVISI